MPLPLPSLIYGSTKIGRGRKKPALPTKCACKEDAAWTHRYYLSVGRVSKPQVFCTFCWKLEFELPASNVQLSTFNVGLQRLDEVDKPFLLLITEGEMRRQTDFILQQAVGSHFLTTF